MNLDLGQFLRTLLYRLPVAKFKAFVNRIKFMTHKITKLAPNAQAVETINQLFAALAIEDVAAREQALLKVLHKSLWYRNQPDGSITIDKNITQFSLPKALGAVHMFEVPVKVKEVHRGNPMTVGFGEFAETGREDKYFICRKDDLFCQHPSPIIVFWPQTGGEAKIRNFGSLV